MSVGIIAIVPKSIPVQVSFKIRSLVGEALEDLSLHIENFVRVERGRVKINGQEKVRRVFALFSIRTGFAIEMFWRDPDEFRDARSRVREKTVLRAKNKIFKF